MGGGGSGDTTVRNEPPAWLKPYAQQFLGGAAQIASQPYNPYPGMTLAPLSPEQQAAMYMGTQRATQGSAVGNAAQQMATNTLQGGYFDNPYLSDAIRLAQEEQIPGIGFMSRQGGSYGNTGIAQAAAENMGDISSSMRFANYDAERDRQMQAATMAPQLAGMDYEDMKMLMGIGDASRSYQQELLDNAVGQWETAQQWPYSQYDWFANQMRAAGFGTGYGETTSPDPNRSNPLANFVGGGMALGGLYDVLSSLG
ncbi:MAG: hypothetical protein NHG36_02555 [Chromatiaceae bacterium]|nr:hypothetical protein [Candidatus Thioaporhodococcus sediminis]